MAKEDIEVKIIDHITGESKSVYHLKHVIVIGTCPPDINDGGVYKLMYGSINKNEMTKAALALLHDEDGEGEKAFAGALMFAMIGKMLTGQDGVSYTATDLSAKDETPDIGGPMGDFLRDMEKGDS